KPYDVSIAAPGSDDSYFISDRGGSSLNLKLKSIEGMATYPRTLRIEAKATALFTLEFPKIPDNVGYINLIEGKGTTGNEWNFYGIDLTK
ncbi:MAG: hypothetical protein EAZ89_05570, partial [Bacteroidetes bacterium]